LEYKGKKNMVGWVSPIAEEFDYNRWVELVQGGEECGAAAMAPL